MRGWLRTWGRLGATLLLASGFVLGVVVVYAQVPHESTPVIVNPSTGTHLVRDEALAAKIAYQLAWQTWTLVWGAVSIIFFSGAFWAATKRDISHLRSDVTDLKTAFFGDGHKRIHALEAEIAELKGSVRMLLRMRGESVSETVP